jgi:hypothetical protein
MPKQDKKVADILRKHFAHLDRSRGVEDDDVMDDNMALLMGDKDYAPYVQFSIEIPK